MFHVNKTGIEGMPKEKFHGSGKQIKYVGKKIANTNLSFQFIFYIIICSSFKGEKQLIYKIVHIAS